MSSSLTAQLELASRQQSRLRLDELPFVEKELQLAAAGTEAGDRDVQERSVDFASLRHSIRAHAASLRQCGVEDVCGCPSGCPSTTCASNRRRTQFRFWGDPGYVVLDSEPAIPQKGIPIFGPCLLWPNGWMDQDIIWYGDRHRPRRH